ncbi:glycerate dehydrogenase [Chromohalobacter japonicus]|uniref:Glycerate dehydrogenase n=1 Tax=Chromohalobacter japonicus TaxID=223900 RepID=A0A1Q8TFC5_9GAMM|nr:D-2-hydroxyacid dehydrogenase [Chromohalobacter japonicus]OLO12380.1 glycerate dehydrogenase [Chromohalobacter japonicus]
MSHTLVFLDRATLKDSVKLPPLSFEHSWKTYASTPPEKVVSRLRGATIAVVNKVKLTREILEELPNLRFISVAATGTDNIDLNACKELGIVVSNIRGYAIKTVPEHTLALILSLRRNLRGYHQDVAKGEWQKAGQFCFFNHPINDLSGQTLGIIGSGAIGQAVAKLAVAFGIKVIFAEKKGAAKVRAGYTEFDELLRSSDIISLHCPLTPETFNLLGSEEFAKMARHPIVINTARGGLIDEKALVEALKTDQIAAAGMDVTETEPPKLDNPLLKLMEFPNFILTPHIAWASQEAMQTLADQLVGNIESFVCGQPKNLVTV